MTKNLVRFFSVILSVSALAPGVAPSEALAWGPPPPPIRRPMPPPGRPMPPGRPIPPPYRPVPPPVYQPAPPVYPPAPPVVRPAPPMGRGRLFTPPARNQEADEVQAAELMAQAIGSRGCEQAGDALRNLSNVLLSNVKFATQPNPFPPAPGDRRGELREQMRRKWLGHLRSQTFWKIVWDRLAEAYRGCNLTCFDDGIAVGQISGAGYCSASVAVGGLNGVGFQAQAPLPVCETATFTACQVGYDQASSSYSGCGNFTSGGYTSIYNEFKSQDCHM